ncbi:MAG TPA: hypothetical protein DCL77_14305 [Prolixibacteraceae bacterium]|jgi:hypothetical protein|nr:hypothetical protein [Prolixibacteraceae bacterium]
MKSMNLLNIYIAIVSHELTLADTSIEAYCAQSNDLASERTEKYNFGYMSLKWALYQIQAIAPDRVKHIFKAILIEHLAFNKTIDDLQYQILKYSAVAEYKKQIRENTKDRIDLNDLPVVSTGGFNILINETGHNLTARIFRNTKADAILFIETATGKAGLQFRVNSEMNKHEGFKTYFLNQVQAAEANWTFVGETNNLIIHHGLPDQLPTQLNMQYFVNLVTFFFKIKF